MPSLPPRPLSHPAAPRLQDKKVVIWTYDSTNAQWTQQELAFGCAVWRVSWSVTGNILAVSGGDNLVTLWKQNLLGHWEQLGQLSEEQPHVHKS